MVWTLALSCAIGSLGSLASAVLLAKREDARYKIVIWIGFSLLGILCSTICSRVFLASIESIATSDEVGAGQLEFTLDSDATMGRDGDSAYASCILDNGSKIKARLFFKEDTGLLFGDRIAAKAKLKAIAEDKIQDNVSTMTCATCNVDEYETIPRDDSITFLSNLRRSAIDELSCNGTDAATLIEALVCGYRDEVNQNGTMDAFKACGLAHIVAVSGAHLSIISLVLCTMLSALGLGRRAAFLITGTCILGFLVFSGISVSALRSSIMTIIAMFSFTMRRRPSSLNGLATCILAMLATDPSISLSVSFLLSAGSTLGIILFSPLVSSWMETSFKTVGAMIVEPISLTLSSSLITLPASASFFGQVPLLSLVANIIASPLFAISETISFILVFLSLAIPPLSEPLVGLSCLSVTPLQACVQSMASIKGGCIPVDISTPISLAASAILSIALYMLWPTWNAKRAIPVICAIYVIPLIGLLAPIQMPSFDLSTKMEMLDVGQGDAILIQSEGRRALIDTGNQQSKLRDAFAEHGITSIDALFISHPDDDHCACVDDIGAFCKVGKVYLSNGTFECECQKCKGLLDSCKNLVGVDNVISLGYHDNVSFGRASLDVLWPQEFSEEGGNADSLCLLAGFDIDDDGLDDARALLCGDAEDAQIDAIVESNPQVCDLDILKVGHHGSKNAFDSETLSKMNPKIALVSCGKNNRYGHPHSRTVDLLNEAHSKILRTDEHGCIVLDIATESIRISTDR